MQRSTDTTSELCKSGGRVLIVDDDPGVCNVVSDFLQQHGFDVETAANGKAADNVLSHGPVDLVVLGSKPNQPIEGG